MQKRLDDKTEEVLVLKEILKALAGKVERCALTTPATQVRRPG